MIKNKKLISLVAVFAMLVTMFSSFTFASAVTNEEITKGITLTYDGCQKDGNAQKITVTVGYKGMEQGVESYRVKFENLPATITTAEVEELSGGVADYEPTIANNTFSLAVMGSSKSTAAEGELAKITFTSSSELKVQPTLRLSPDTSYMSDPTGRIVVKEAPEAGNAKQIPQTTVKLAVDTAAPSADKDREPAIDEPAPTLPDPIITVERGITLSASELTESNGTYTYVVTVGYKGMEQGVESYRVKFENLPATITTAAVEELSGGVADYEPTIADNTFSLAVMGSSKSTAAEGELAKITFTLSGQPAEDIQLKLSPDSSYMSDPTGRIVVKEAPEAGNAKQIPQANVNLVAPKRTGREVDMPVDETLIEEGQEDTYYIVPKVVDKNTQEELTYGTDYVAEVVYQDADGNVQRVQLTEGQYKNLVNGHFDAANVADLCDRAGIKDIRDVVDKVKYQLYNSNAQVKAQLCQETDDGNVVIGEQTAGGKTDKTEKPVAGPQISIANQTVNVSVNGVAKVSMTPSVKGHGLTSTNKTKFDAALKKLTPEYVISFANLEKTESAQEKEREDNKKYIDLVGAKELEPTEDIKVVGLKAGTGYMYVTLSEDYIKDVKALLQEAGVEKYDEVDASKAAKITVKVSNKSSNSGSGSGSGSGSDDDKNSGTGIIANGDMGGYTDGSGYTTPFTDMAGYDWAAEAVSVLASKGIVQGKGNGIFDPSAKISRAEYAQMVINAIGRSSNSADAAYMDVPTDAWYYHSVAVADSLGIVKGYGNGYFGPMDLITREQMALMTQRAAVVTGKSLVGAAVQTFNDDADISDWAKSAVYELANAGIVNGTGNGAFTPKANATRAEAAVIIYNTFVK